MSKFLDFFVKKEEVEPSISSVSFSEKSELVDYFQKDDRSNPLIYQGIGRVKYGSGVPPAVYDTALAAIKSYPVVYGVITARAEAIAGLGIKIFDVKGGQEAEVKDHEFYPVFNTPNPYQGSFEFLEQVVTSLDVTGNAFISIEKATSGTKQKFEMYLLPTRYMAIIPDSKVKIKEYRFYINGQTVVYKPEEIIHIKYSDVDDSYYGAPPLASATDILTFESFRIQFMNTFFKNGAIPVGLLETDSTLSDSLLRKLRGDWTAIHGGISNSSKIAILQGGLKYKPVSSPIKDLDLSGLKRISREDILTIFKCPESVLGSMDNTSGEEGKAALQAFWRTSLIPLVRRIESSLNRGLKELSLKGGKQIVRFNLKAVEALADDKESVARYISTLMAASVMTANEGRSIIGLPPSTDPNASKLLISNSFWGNQMMPADQAAGTDPTAVNDQKPTTKPKPAAKPKPTS